MSNPSQINYSTDSILTLMKMNGRIKWCDDIPLMPDTFFQYFFGDMCLQLPLFIPNNSDYRPSLCLLTCSIAP